MSSQTPRGLTLIEIIVAIAFVGIAAVILVIVIQSARAESRRQLCQRNLESIGKAMFMYADVPANGSFPNAAENKDEPFTSNPSLSWGLLYNKYIADPRVFSCPGNPIAPERLSKLVNNNEPFLIDTVRTTFAYDPGHSTSDALIALAADMKGAGAGSDNHGASAGQNVLIANGSVNFRKSVVNPLAKGQDSNIYSLNPEIPRNEDSFIRQK
jgi:prepilin-type N-terminal cleavage/methylation domain-containing protein